MTENSPERIPLDKQWYPRFEALASFQAYEYFDGDKLHREEEKRKFLAGEIEVPSLDYPKLNIADLDKKERSLIQLKTDIIREEGNIEVQWTYRWRINEKIAEVRLMRAAALGDMSHFKRYTEFVYGQPESDFFLYALQSIRDLATKHIGSQNPEISTAARN
jgi:hypothetical protein